MGRLDITTLLPIDRWAEIIGLDPRHFRQVTTSRKPNTSCSAVWKEHPWQESDAVSRDDVTLAISQAEERASEYLGYSPLPSWVLRERHRTPKPADRSLYNVNASDLQGFNLSLPLLRGHFIEGGRMTQTLISADAPVVYSDVDGDGYCEVGTLSFATTVTDIEEISIHYPGKSGLGHWGIRPFRTCHITGGICTITFWRHQMVIEELFEALDPSAVNGDDDSNFLDTADVYRQWTDPASMCTLVWDPKASSCTDGCGQETQTACLIPRDYEASIVGYLPAVWVGNGADSGADGGADGDWAGDSIKEERNPDHIIVNYRAGYRDQRLLYPHLRMDPEFERAISYYALTLLNREVCSCSNVEMLKKHWCTDYSMRTPGTAFNVPSTILDNPLGQTRGAVGLWSLILKRRLARAVDY